MGVWWWKAELKTKCFHFMISDIFHFFTFQSNKISSVMPLLAVPLLQKKEEKYSTSQKYNTVHCMNSAPLLGTSYSGIQWPALRPTLWNDGLLILIPHRVRCRTELRTNYSNYLAPFSVQTCMDTTYFYHPLFRIFTHSLGAANTLPSGIINHMSLVILCFKLLLFQSKIL